MQHVKTFTKREVSYWTDGKGREYDISEMSDDYVWNCIIFTQNRLSALSQLPSMKVVNAKIKSAKKDIRVLLNEMSKREIHNIFIDRDEGCESR